MTRRSLTLGVSGLSLAAAAGLLVAGPLTPSGGPVASTYKTLTEVEPRIAINAINTPGDAINLYRITQPGSYYLTGDVSVPAGKYGIRIDADNVTIDLAGFRVVGSGGNGSDVGVASSANHVTLRNGSISGFSGRGVVSANDARLSDLHVANCGSDGIYVDHGAEVTNCQVTSCLGRGIFVIAEAGIIEHCTARFCGEGFVTLGHTTMQACSAADCTGNGFELVGVGHACVANHNGGIGFKAMDGSALVACTSTNNTLDGFQIFTGSTAEGCTARSNNTYGFQAGASAVITRCNATANAVGGVRITGSYVQVSDCVLTGVSGFPIIQVNAVVGPQIERNTLCGGTLAVNAPSATGGLLVCNTFIDQTTAPYSVSASFQVGPQVSAAGVIASTSPFANFVQ